MKEYITIKNFGPIKSIERLELKPLTVLIGESAIGKSTLMKVATMMRYLFKLSNIRSYLKHSHITNSPFRVRFDTMMNDTGLYSMLSSESLLAYSVVMDSGQEYTIRASGKGLEKLPMIHKEDLVFTKVSFVSENRNIIPMWTEKASSNVGATLGFYFHETNTEFSRAVEKDMIVDLQYVNMRLHITHPKGKAVKLVVEHKDSTHGKIDLRNASSGIQTSAPLAIIVKYMANEFSFKDAFNRSVLSYLHQVDMLTKFKPVADSSDLNNYVYVHIEEPELSLFPDAQCMLVDELVYSATHTNHDRKMSMMMATHSPYILNYLNIILNQNDDSRASVTEDELAVYRLSDGSAYNLLAKDEKGRVMVDTYDLTEMMGRIYKEYTQLIK